MRFGIVGAGIVGQTLGAALAAGGHRVTIGVRHPGPEAMEAPRAQAATLTEWVRRTGGTVAGVAAAAEGAEAVINATRGTASLAALAPAGPHLAGKVLIDVANPLDFSRGMPPFLDPALSGPTSLAEEIQKAHPQAKVVKAFSTVAAPVMVNPALIPGAHDLPMAGDAEGKALVRDLAAAWGWRHVVDLGDLVGARAMEGLLPLWVRLWQTYGTLSVNIHVVRAGGAA